MLVFLDRDGVMVPAKSWTSPQLLSDGFPAFSDKAVRVLQHVVSGGVTVMLTTSHKSRFSVEEWKNIEIQTIKRNDHKSSCPICLENLYRKEKNVFSCLLCDLYTTRLLITKDIIERNIGILYLSKT